MYFLLALVYFVFSTIPITEVSAEVTLTIKSGNNQKTTRGQTFADPIVVTIAGLSSGPNYGVSASPYPRDGVLFSLTEDGQFKDTASRIITEDGDFTFYVQAKLGSFYDTPSVKVDINLGEGVILNVSFTATITDVLYFSDTSTTRNVDEGATAGANIGAAVSAIHWANADSDDSNDVTLEYSLEGDDAASFSIDSSTGQLQVSGPLGPAGNTYSVTVKVENKDPADTSMVRSSDTIDVTINVAEPPPPPPPPPPPSVNTLPLVQTDPVTYTTLTVKRVGNPTVELSWNIPAGFNPQAILEYQYSMDAGETWNPTGSTDTSITLNRDGSNTLAMNKFKVRAVSLNADRTARVVTFVLSAPIIYECPVGWGRSDGFGGRTRRVLLYEVKLEMDLHNLVSIYKPDWVAIYVHPDEGLENLQGWKLQVAIPYNHHRTYLLTAENSVIVASKIEGVEGGFAFIENPEEDPLPMVGMGFTGALVPGFDYRLYDDTGRKIDFGIACYKRSDIFQVLKEMEDPRVLRNVLLETLDWDVPYLRSEWTVPVPVPAAPSQIKGNIVGTWGALKKQ